MFEPPNSLDKSKREAKEVSRHQVLVHQPAQPAYTPKDSVAVQKHDKAKKASITRVMQVAKPPPAKEVRQLKETELIRTTNTKKAPTQRKRKSIAPPPPPMVLATEHPINQTAKLCGCRHGDLEALKSFSKADAAYYIKPNRFMETIGCLDCAISVVNMLLEVQGHQKAVVFYCDEGIKGFDAPSDDPMKEELTCNLVLCAPCMAIRRISFYKENAGRGGRGRNSRGRK
jgi:hypothetical protein